MIIKKHIMPITLALAVCSSPSFGQSVLLKDDFGNGLGQWAISAGWPGIANVVNEQLVVSEDSLGPMQTNNPRATHVPAVLAVPAWDPLADQQTLELRADLVSANQNDAFAGIVFNWDIPSLGSAYAFVKDEDELGLTKIYSGASSFAWFYYTNQPVKNQNVTLALALTRDGPNLDITTRVLDKDNADAVLFERTVIDTPQADPVLPSGAVKGEVGMADPAGTPWPLLKGPAYIELTMTWMDPLHAPDPRAQLIYDNLEVRQYPAPQLAIQNAVLLSWPETPGQWTLQSAPSLDGPWETVSNPWRRDAAGRTEVAIPAPDTMRLYRLRQAP